MVPRGGVAGCPALARPARWLWVRRGTHTRRRAINNRYQAFKHINHLNSYFMTAQPDQDVRAIIYTRVSHDKAGGRSVAEQEAECRQECERRGWRVAEVLTDNDRSATRFATKDRPEYARLRTVLQPGDVLVVWEASRVGRSLDTYVDLRRLCIERSVLLSYSGRLYDLDDGDDRFSTGLDALVAEREAEQARERTVRAHRANLAAGRPHGRPPYGYKIVRDPDTGQAVGRVPDPLRAPLVQEAARRVLDGQSLREVARWLESKDPQTWRPGKVVRLLGNPTLAGYRTHAARTASGRRGPLKAVCEGTWEPILDRDTHNDLVALFAARQTGPRGPEPKHLLSGIAECGRCGQAMWWGRGTARKSGGYHHVYACETGHVVRGEDIVDGVVTAVVEGILGTPEARAELASVPPEPIPVAHGELDDLKEQLRAVEDQIVANTIPAEVGARVATRLAERIAAVEAAAAPVFTDPLVHQIATAPDPVAMWRSLPVARKREFIRAVMTVRIDKIGKGRWHAREDGIVITPRRRK